MMTALGNKKNVKIFSFALAGVFIASVGIMAIVSMGDTANAALHPILGSSISVR
ncbi:MAG: hypothetical protein ACLUIQ_12265 [Dialister invisus]